MKMMNYLPCVFCLLLLGCGGGAKIEENVDDPEYRETIWDGAVDDSELQERDDLVFVADNETPYSGWTKWKHEDGGLFGLVQYKDGRKHGEYRIWWGSGQLMTKSTYVEGSLNGLETEWYENGQMSSQCDHKDGKPHGIYTTWYENGKKWSETTYEDGKQHGVATMWGENGEVLLKAEYKNGVEVKQD